MNKSFDVNKIIQNSLKVKSPKKRVTGPHKVLIVSPKEYWVIVALGYDNSPCFGLRWFNTKKGYPNTFGYKTWIILPQNISLSIIQTFPFNGNEKLKLKKYLAEEIAGADLSDITTLVIDEV